MNLDCETVQTTEESLMQVLGINETQLQRHLLGFKDTDFEVNTDVATDRWLPMLNVVAGFEVEDVDCGHTCWYHATRVTELTSFRDGVRSLPRQISRTWDSLFALVADCVSREEWSEFRSETEKDNFGGHAKEVIEAWMADEGPYAFLFAESSLSPGQTGNHDYFATSELVEFISICFERKYGVSLHARHQTATKPALIKFKTPGIRAMHLGAAFDYLLHRRNGWSLSCLSPCFSGEGRDVASEQMMKAIPVVEATRRYGKHSSYSLSLPEFHVALRG